MAFFKTIEEEQWHQEQEYLKNFNGADYYKEFCKEENTYKTFAMTCLHSAFSNDAKPGESILDLGCGPNISTSIAASKWFKNLIASDFLESNREIIRKWLRKDPNAFDYKHMFRAAAALEHESDVTKLEARVRNRMKEVIPCNVHLNNPIEPDQRKFDAIVSTFVLDSANLTLESYRRSLCNVANLLKPGGRFFMVGALKTSYYTVAGHKFDAPVVTKNDIKQGLIDSGLIPELWLIQPFINENVSDGKSIFFVKSTKAV